MDILLFTSVGALIVFLLCLFLNRVIRFSHAQAASIVSLISLAVIVPYSIAIQISGDTFALYICAALLVTFAFYFIGSGGIKALSGDDGKTVHWAPITILGFFIVLIIINGALVTMAILGVSFTKKNNEGEEIIINTRFPGEVPNAYHKKEAFYNEHQDKMAEQELRDWSVQIGFDSLPVHQSENKLIMVSAFDKRMQPIEGAEVVVKFSRPGEQELNKKLVLSMSEKPGIYEAEVNFERRGPWRTELLIVKNDETYESVLHDDKGLIVQCPVGVECFQPKKVH